MINNSNKIFSAVLFMALHFTSVFAQQKWSVQQCIDHAISNNIQLKQSKLNAESAELNLLQSKANVLPTLNGYGSHNYSFGRTIDPLTNLFATNRVQSNSVGLSSNVVVYSGLQNKNTIQQNVHNTQAKKYDLEKSENDIRINVINAYLQILFSEELLTVSKNQFNVTRQQLERIKKLVEVGSSSKGAQLEIEAQLASEELQIVNAENQRDLAYLNMVQILNLENSDGFEIERPVIEIAGDKNILESPATIYQVALANQPAVKSAESDVLTSQSALAVAKGGLSPRLTLNASYGSGYSQLRKEVIGSAGFVGYDTIGITSANDAVLIPRFQSDYRVTPFGNQLQDNINKTIGFNLSIPVFNGFSTRTRISQAKIALENSKNNLELSKQAIRNAIQKAHADANAAFKKFKATEQSVKALKESFFYTEQKYNVGMVNTIEYNDSKNKMIKAESDMLQAKFDYVFKVKILDYYLGKPLSL